MVRQAPAGHDGPAAGHDAGDAVGRQRHIPQQHAGVDGHVVHALLALFDHGVAEDLPRQGVRLAVDLLQRLVDRHRADGDGGVADDPFAGGVDVVAGGEVHHGVRAPLGGPLQFVHLLGDGAGDRRVADVGVDLHQERLADDHRLGFGVVDVVGDDGPAGGHLAADQFHVAVLAQRHEPHLRGDDPVPGIVHLGHGPAVDGAAGHRPRALPLRGRRAAAHGRLAVVEQVPFPAAVRLGVRPRLNPRRPERLQAHHRIAARTRPCGRPGTARSAAPSGEGSRAISVTGTRRPCSGSVVKASEWDFSDCVVGGAGGSFWAGSILGRAQLCFWVLNGLLTSFAGITRTGSTVAGCVSPISAPAGAPVWS